MDKPSLLTRISSSPLLSACLLLTTAIVTLSWYRADATQRAPAIPGYDWGQHPNALLIVYPPKDCGCGPSPTVRVEEGLKHGLDVVVIAPAPSKSLDALRKGKFSPPRFSLATNISPDIIKHFSPGDEPVTIRIKRGRIVARTTGDNSPESFFN